MAGGGVLVEILKEIRDELRNVRSGVRDEMRALRNETAERFGLVETSLLDLVEQQGFIVRYTRAIAERDTQLERLIALEARVDKLASK